MKYLNTFHQEAVMRKLQKIAELKKLPLKSADAVAYMKKNMQIAATM
jgi:hypothetical protein